MIVLDASAALELLLNTRLAVPVAQLVLADGQSVHSPHLIDIEIAQVLRRLVRLKQIDANRAAMALDDFADMPIVRHAHQMLLAAIWSLRDHATAYDATYLALAQALDARLVTCDAALAAVPGMKRRVRLVV